MDERIKVSVFCITYNHKEVIEKTLQGFLMQKTDFIYEIMVHDDCSTDGTQEILKKYEKKYENIHVIYEDQNVYSTGASVVAVLLPYVRGKYYAICEGDDYWIDENKLQKQYDFMEKHQDVMLCTHSAIEELWETKKNRIIPSNEPKSKYISIEKAILVGGAHYPTCSFMVRKTIDYIPNRWGDGICGDYSFLLQAGLKGKIYYMSDPMAKKNTCYPGSWSDTHKTSEILKVHLRKEIESLQLFDNATEKQYTSIVQRRIRLIESRIACDIDGDYKQFFFNKNFKGIYKTYTLKRKISFFLRAFMPNTFKLIKRLQHIIRG